MGKYPRLFPLLLLIILSLLAGSLAYQAPAHDHIPIGWLGDQLFLDYSGGLGQDVVERGAWYADDLTPDSPTGRSRWSRQYATIKLPNVGRGVDREITLLVQGFPADVVWEHSTLPAPHLAQQPSVTIRADGVIIGTFTPTTQWAEYTLRVPSHIQRGDHLTLTLETSATFTDTARGADARPKGVRVAGVALTYRGFDTLWHPPLDQTLREQFYTLMQQTLTPSLQACVFLLLLILLTYAFLLRVLAPLPMGGSVAFVVAALCAGVGGIGLSLARLWMGAILALGLGGMLIALAIAYHRPLLVMTRALIARYQRGHALNYGIISAALALAGYAIARAITQADLYLAIGTLMLQRMFPDSLLLVLLAMCSLILIVVLGREGLPRLVNTLVTVPGHSSLAFVLTIIVGGIWLGYEALVVAQLPYVGHADYADNAVVARNLVQGRGWVVDYVTQFYTLYDNVTRPQETWPLLQPVWIAPFIALLGNAAWVVKIPNLIFNAILLILIFTIGKRLWDWHVGFVAALLTLTNHLFFKLTIYATSDLAFVVFVTAAIFLLYRSCDYSPARQAPPTRPAMRWLLASGILTGFMMVQKPSGGVIALGMGLWLLYTLAQHAPQDNKPPLSRQFQRVVIYAMVWALPALLILSPYLVRNVILFGAPVYSTEKYDAWVLGYRGDSGDAWSDIYRVYVPELGGAGIPDRSWILRWGFDLTLAKMTTQVEAVRDYLLPAWNGLPEQLAGRDNQIPLLNQNERKNIVPGAGAWGALAGVIAALHSRRRLLALLIMAFAPYTLFLITYWHANEERYFLMVIPWLALLAAWVLWGMYENIAAIGDGRWSPLGFILVCLAVVTIIQPSWQIIANKVQHEPDQWAPDLIAYDWLRENTPPNAVVMTRNPWQLNWHAQRPAVMIPNTDNRAILMFLVQHYHVEYIVFDSIQRVKGDAARLLSPLTTIHGREVGATIDGFTLVYASPTVDNRVLIYQINSMPVDERTPLEGRYRLHPAHNSVSRWLHMVAQLT